MVKTTPNWCRICRVNLSLSHACSLARFMLQGCSFVHSTVEKIKHLATQALHPLEFLVDWKRYS